LLKRRDIIYPILIYVAALAIIYTGVRPYGEGDGLLEIWRANDVLSSGWWDWSMKAHNNTSLALTVVSPFLAKLLNTSIVFIFRNIYPLFFAITPVILYFVFRRLMTESQALLSALFFAILPPTYQEIPSIAKSMLAQPFAAAGLLAYTSHIGSKYKIPLVVLLTALCLALHYTIGLMVIMFYVASFVVAWNKQSFIILTIISVFAIAFLSTIGGGVITKGISNWNNLPDHDGDPINTVLFGGDFETASDRNDGKTKGLLVEKLGINPPLTLPFKVSSDVKRGSIYLVTLFMLLGAVYWFTHWHKMWTHKELGAMIAISAVSVILALTVPWFTKGLYVSRWIQMAGMPMSALVGLSTKCYPKRYSYTVVLTGLILLLVLAR